jgi:hypothetical protein
MARGTNRIGWLIGGALALLAAGPAAAVGPPAPASELSRVPLLGMQAPGEPVVLGPSFEARFFAPTVPLRFGPRPGQALYFNQRTLGRLHYSTPMRIARNDVMLHFEAPGDGIALVEFEIEF